MKVSKEYYSHYSLRGITLGDKGNFCGHLGVNVVAIDYNSESVLLTGFHGDSVTIKGLNKEELKRVYYTKKAKKNEYNLWVSIDAIERYKKSNEEIK